MTSFHSPVHNYALNAVWRAISAPAARMPYIVTFAAIRVGAFAWATAVPWTSLKGHGDVSFSLRNLGITLFCAAAAVLDMKRLRDIGLRSWYYFIVLAASAVPIAMTNLGTLVL